MTFTAVLDLHGKTATGIDVPAETVEAMHRGKRVPVSVTINGHTYRTTVCPRKGAYMIPVAAAIREAAGIRAGQAVEVDIQVDDEPRVVEVPEDLQRALDANPSAGAAFARLAYSHQKQHVLAVEEAKTAETRTRRIAAAVASLLK